MNNKLSHEYTELAMNTSYDQLPIPRCSKAAMCIWPQYNDIHSKFKDYVISYK